MNEVFGVRRLAAAFTRDAKAAASRRTPKAALLLLFLAPALHAQLTLEDAIRRAVEHSPDVRAARAGVREAAANATLARQTFRPASTISTTPGWATGVPIAILGQVPAIGSIEAHETLYDNYARTDVIAADAQTQARQADVDAASRQAAEAAAQAYAQLASDLATIDAAQRRVTAFSGEVTRVEALQAEGRATELDVSRAELQVARAQLQVSAAQSSRMNDEAHLRTLIGASEPIAIAPAPVPHLAAETADDIAVAQRNDVALAGLDKQLTDLHASVALLSRPFQPVVQAQVQYSELFNMYSKYYQNFTPHDFSIGASVVIPLWSGGRRAAGVERIRAQMERLEAQRQLRATGIETQVRDAETDLIQARAERDLAGRAKTVAEQGLRINQLLAQEGRGEPNAVALSQAEIADADEQIAKAELHLAIASARLLSARGELVR